MQLDDEMMCNLKESCQQSTTKTLRKIVKAKHKCLTNTQFDGYSSGEEWTTDATKQLKRLFVSSKNKKKFKCPNCQEYQI